MKKINLIIPAAGEATRLKPLSNNMSKIMVRVNGKPCLDYIIEQAKKLADVQEIIIVDGKFDDVREYCSKKYPEIKFVKQKTLNGPRPAIALGFGEIVVPRPTVVWLGDAIILTEKMDLGTDFLLCKEVENHSSWCMWDGTTYFDKPEKNIKGGVALVGLYSFKNGELAKQAFDESSDYDISSALQGYESLNNALVFADQRTTEWYDIGTLSVYHETCAKLLRLKSRAFNNIAFNDDLGTVTKTPDYTSKHSVDTLHAERSWYNSITAEQSMFVPRILPHKTDLIMSYESGSLLSDLMLYENLSEANWSFIMDKLFRIKANYFSTPIEKCNRFVKTHHDGFVGLSKNIWVDKSKTRLADVPLTPKERSKLIDIAYDMWNNVTPVDVHHGDLHFGNILYNHYTNQFKFIDPRGNYGGLIGTIGDNFYDWCKLAHDLYHGYSSIVSNTSQNKTVKKVFVEKLEEFNLPVKQILDGGLLLLATCIPLHYDDPERQWKMTRVVKKELDN